MPIEQWNICVLGCAIDLSSVKGPSLGGVIPRFCWIGSHCDTASNFFLVAASEHLLNSVTVLNMDSSWCSRPTDFRICFQLMFWSSIYADWSSLSFRSRSYSPVSSTFIICNAHRLWVYLGLSRVVYCRLSVCFPAIPSPSGLTIHRTHVQGSIQIWNERGDR